MPMITRDEIKQPAKSYAEIGQKHGQRAAKEALSGARIAAVGCNYPDMAYELLQAYQSVENTCSANWVRCTKARRI